MPGCAIASIRPSPPRECELAFDKADIAPLPSHRLQKKHGTQPVHGQAVISCHRPVTRALIDTRSGRNTS